MCCIHKNKARTVNILRFHGKAEDIAQVDIRRKEIDAVASVNSILVLGEIVTTCVPLSYKHNWIEPGEVVLFLIYLCRSDQLLK